MKFYKYEIIKNGAKFKYIMNSIINKVNNFDDKESTYENNIDIYKTKIYDIFNLTGENLIK